MRTGRQGAEAVRHGARKIAEGRADSAGKAFGHHQIMISNSRAGKVWVEQQEEGAW